MTEEWRPVVGYEGRYEVSNLGRVRTLCQRPGMKKPQRRKDSVHLFVQLYGGLPIQANKDIHSLVAAAFLGPRPDGMEVCHNNGDARDNRLENLRYDTRSANQRDAVAHGTNWNTAKTHCAHGHEFTPENTRIESRTGTGLPRRVCRACMRKKMSRYRAAKATARKA